MIDLKSLLITDDEFLKLKKLVYKNFGINLTDAKRALVIGRLQSILKKYGFDDFESYYQYVASDVNGAAISELINKISTNFTYFYREEEHFKFFSREVLPDLVEWLNKKKDRDIRLWCAGCASGEEPYTIVMMMMEYFGNGYHLWDSGILATDISENALEMAKKGVYQIEAISKLPVEYKNKYMEKIGNEECSVSEKVKKEVTFRRFNLMNKKFPFKKRFHAIFCRNVMIYFDQETKDRLIAKFYDLLEPGGYLFIGHSETVDRANNFFKYVSPAVYRKK